MDNGIENTHTLRHIYTFENKTSQKENFDLWHKFDNIYILE